MVTPDNLVSKRPAMSVLDNSSPKKKQSLLESDDSDCESVVFELLLETPPKKLPRAVDDVEAAEQDPCPCTPVKTLQFGSSGQSNESDDNVEFELLLETPDKNPGAVDDAEQEHCTPAEKPLISEGSEEEAPPVQQHLQPVPPARLPSPVHARDNINTAQQGARRKRQTVSVLSDDEEWVDEGSGEEASDDSEMEEIIIESPIQQHQQSAPTKSARRSSTVSDINIARGKHSMRAIDSARWNITKHSTDPTLLRLCSKKTSGSVYTVAASRAGKAAKYLDPEQAAEVLAKDCCSKACTGKITRQELMDERIQFFTTTTSEEDASNYILRTLRHDQGEMKIASKKVCRDVYTAVYGISRGKLTNIQTARKHGPQGRLSSLRGKGKLQRSLSGTPEENQKGVKVEQCVAFWTNFFLLCQRPRPKLRLFPVNKSYQMIYKEYFVPWFQKTYPDSTNVPSVGTLKRARRHHNFDDVKRRVKHYHCRCATCAALQAQRLKAFKNGDDEAKYKKDFELHNLCVWTWRDLEIYWKGVSVSSPQTTAMLSFDDTGKVGLPLFTKREYKNLGSSRQYWTPFLLYDHGAGTRDYVYTPTGRFHKGGNRYCTLLFIAVLRIKNNPAHPSHTARRLVLVADNYSENKNNTLFQFWAHMITCGWFDEVILLFGPVGHTHFWLDQMHGVHNNELCNNTIGDLGHLVSFYPYAWTDPKKRPSASVMDAQFDWDNYYKPHGNNISGFTKTAGNPQVGGAFRLKRTGQRTVELHFKRDAVDRDWLGQDGKAGSSGFHVLRARPRGRPTTLKGSNLIMQKKHLKQLQGTAIKMPWRQKI